MSSDAPAQKRPQSALNSFISGGVGGMCLVAAGHPLDTIKVRLQTTNMYSGMVDCFQRTVAKEGVKGLYRGMAAPIAGVTPMYAICFLGYSHGQSIQRAMFNIKDRELTLLEHWNAGCLSGVYTTAIMVPGERIKVLMQLSGTGAAGTERYSGPMDCVKKVMAAEGIRGLYRGTVATMLRDVPGSGMYFASYVGFKRLFTPEGKEGELSPVRVFFAGGLAGICNWLISLPPDTLKSRLQAAPAGKYPGGLMQVFRELVATEGAGALYKGFIPVMSRAFPANAAMFLGMEVAKKLLETIGIY